MIIFDKKALKLLYLFIFILLLSPVLIACKQKTVIVDNWEEQTLYAKECGMDGLPCCSDKDKVCLYEQECCIDPNNLERNMCANECACGEKGAFCCVDDKCGEGLSCFAGRCVECGSISDHCCQNGDECNNDLVCHNDLCVVCGIPGNPCCTIGFACVNQEKRDNNRTECRRDQCIFCGSNNAISCQNEPICAPGHLLNNNFCLKCGETNQPCCNEESGVEYTCIDDSLVCELGFCTKK
ncbi:MAG: hypothetical protein U9Q85_00705 [Patescibacteria group bacterium]|nr:hypothetical protein [Patescibacteria group bacterium]